jgi:hypothetical protein
MTCYATCVCSCIRLAMVKVDNASCIFWSCKIDQRIFTTKICPYTVQFFAPEIDHIFVLTKSVIFC